MHETFVLVAPQNKDCSNCQFLNYLTQRVIHLSQAHIY